MKSQISSNRVDFKRILLAVFILIGMNLPAVGQDLTSGNIFGHPASGDIITAPSELRDLIERYSADLRALERYYDFSFSAARLSRLKAFNQEFLGILDGIAFNRLGIDGQVDYLLFKNHLTRELQRLDRERDTAHEASQLLPFAESIIGLKEDLQKMQWIEASSAAKTLNDLRKQIESTQSRAKDIATEAGIKRTVIRDAGTMTAVLRIGLKGWFEFYDGYDPQFTWWAAEAYKATDTALQSYMEYLRKLSGDRPGVGSYMLKEPVGRDVLIQELAFEMLPYSPKEILAIGWQELAWCEEQRLAASRELGFGDDWQAAMEHVKSLHVGPGEQPELIRFLTYEAIEFLEEHDSLTIPPMVKDLLRMRMMPLERQKTTPFFTGGEVISVAYPMDTVPYEQKISTMRGNNPHFSRAVVHHELVPGHNLQGFMAARHRTYRRPFSTSFFGEGWPLYWEMRLWDMDFQRSPEDRIGMLFWRMHRCARIIFSISYQLGQMTAEEAIDFLVDRIGHERDNATVEAMAHLSGRAYGGRPLAQSSYLIGGLQIRSLSRELVDSGKMSPKEFHDAVLREGSIPIELLRAKLTGEMLSPDFSSKWKFYTFADQTRK
jgi:uncharacterized protein (DUF885 family)